MLNFDFYESGRGETIVVTFPDGGIGVVDAHPSSQGDRPTIEEIVHNKKIHFICLTHPHDDHGRDLVPLLKTGIKPDRFWHTVSDFDTLLLSLRETEVSRPFRAAVKAYRNEQAAFFVSLMELCSEREIEEFPLREELQPQSIGGVSVHCLWPKNNTIQAYVAARRRFIKGEKLSSDPNEISAILAFEYGKSVVVLGADAVQANWRETIKIYNRRELPKARVLKVPHHGAANAFDGRPERSFLQICSEEERPIAILFGGDAKHPHPAVHTELRRRTRLICLSNGLKANDSLRNPLSLEMPHAVARAASPVCHPHVSVRIAPSGDIQCSGNSCDFCN